MPCRKLARLMERTATLSLATHWAHCLARAFCCKRVVGFQPALGELKGLGFVGAGVQVIYRGGVSEQKADAAHAVQFLGQQLVAVDGEVGRGQAECVGIAQVAPQMVGNGGSPVVYDAVL